MFNFPFSDRVNCYLSLQVLPNRVTELFCSAQRRSVPLHSVDYATPATLEQEKLQVVPADAKALLSLEGTILFPQR